MQAKQPTLKDHLLALVATLLVVLGVAAVWSGVAIFSQRASGWMALVAGVDAAIMMRMAGFPGGARRAGIALLATVLAIACGAFAVAATLIGLQFGVPPHEAIWNISPTLASWWWRLNMSGWDIVALLLALPLAWRLGR